jgi:hypothetical protein
MAAVLLRTMQSRQHLKKFAQHTVKKYMRFPFGTLPAIGNGTAHGCHMQLPQQFFGLWWRIILF